MLISPGKISFETNGHLLNSIFSVSEKIVDKTCIVVNKMI